MSYSVSGVPHADYCGILGCRLGVAGDELIGDLCAASDLGALLRVGERGDAVGQDLAVAADRAARVPRARRFAGVRSSTG